MALETWAREVLSRTTRDSDKLKEALINFWRQYLSQAWLLP